jgi:hypothetical protein
VVWEPTEASASVGSFKCTILHGTMPKKQNKPPEPEEPPTPSGEWWFHTSFRHGKIRRIKVWVEKKRHRQSPAPEIGGKQCKQSQE